MKAFPALFLIASVISIAAVSGYSQAKSEPSTCSWKSAPGLTPEPGNTMRQALFKWSNSTIRVVCDPADPADTDAENVDKKVKQFVTEVKKEHPSAAPSISDVRKGRTAGKQIYVGIGSNAVLIRIFATPENIYLFTAKAGRYDIDEVAGFLNFFRITE